MSPKQQTLAGLTEEFFTNVETLPDTAEGQKEAMDLLREFTAKARSFTVRKEIDDIKDVVLDDLKDISKWPKGRLAFEKPGEEGVEYMREVQYKFTASERVFILDVMTIPVASLLQTEGGKNYRILSVEPVWDAALTQKCYLCTASEETDGN